MIFADVDDKQIFKAIELGKKESLNLGFQYIVTLNSIGEMHKKLIQAKIIEQEDIRCTLKDDREEGLLLKRQFN